MEDLVASGAATFKRHITVTAPDGSQHEYLPGDWLTAPPWNVETRTCTWIACRCTTGCNSQHALTELLRFTSGLLDSRFEIGGSRPSRPRQDIAFEPPGLSTRPALQPACSEKNSACRSLLTDRIRLRSGHISPPKTGSKRPLSTCSARSANIWSGFGRFPSGPASAALGIAAGSKVKLQRAHGLKNPDLLWKQMQKFARLSTLAKDAPPERVAVTSFLCRTYMGVCGPNWIIIGEAASQSDPITGNGVTAALRNAEEASALICRYRHRKIIPVLARTAYNLRVSGIGRYFNSLIEKLFYQPPLRARLGLFGTARAYTVPAWLTNLLYSRVRPRRLFGTVIFCSALVTIRAVAWGLFQLSRLFGTRPSNSRHAVDERRGQRRALHTPR